MKPELIKDNENGKTYQAEGFKIVYKYKGKIGGDNATNQHEQIYLISGATEVTVVDKVEKFIAPVYFEIPATTYHKILALTDIAFILIED